MYVVIVEVNRLQDLAEHVHFEYTDFGHLELVANQISNVLGVTLIELFMQASFANQIVCVYVSGNVFQAVFVGFFSSISWSIFDWIGLKISSDII